MRTLKYKYDFLEVETGNIGSPEALPFVYHTMVRHASYNRGSWYEKDIYRTETEAYNGHYKTIDRCREEFYGEIAGEYCEDDDDYDEYDENDNE